MGKCAFTLPQHPLLVLIRITKLVAGYSCVWNASSGAY